MHSVTPIDVERFPTADSTPRDSITLQEEYLRWVSRLKIALQITSLASFGNAGVNICIPQVLQEQQTDRFFAVMAVGSICVAIVNYYLAIEPSKGIKSLQKFSKNITQPKYTNPLTQTDINNLEIVRKLHDKLSNAKGIFAFLPVLIPLLLGLTRPSTASDVGIISNLANVIIIAIASLGIEKVSRIEIIAMLKKYSVPPQSQLT